MGNPIGSLIRFRKSISTARKNVWITNIEAMPSLIFATLMGGPFLTGYLLYLGGNSSQIGLVLAISTLVNLVQIPMALLMQKIRNRKILLISTFTIFRVMWLSVALIPLFVPREWAVIVYAILFAVAFLVNAAGSVVWATLISDVIPVTIRGRYFGIRNMMVAAASSLTLFIGGQIMDAYPGGQGFTYLFFICAIMVLINTPIMFYYPNAPFEASTESEPLRMLKKPFADRLFIKSILFIAIYVFILNITAPLFSYVMLEVMHLSYSIVSLIFVIHTVAIMFSNYIWGNLNARYRNQTLLFFTLPFIGGSCLLWGALALLPAIFVLILIHIILGIGVAGFNQMVFNYIIADTPKSERSMYFAVFSAITGFFAFLGPLVGGRLYEWAKLGPQWIELFGISMFIGVVLLIYGFVIGSRVLRNA